MVLIFYSIFFFEIQAFKNTDYYDASFLQTFSLVIPDPGQATWYIGVFGWTSCTYTISVQLSNACPNHCSNHGTCNAEGVCVCEGGFTGVDCSISTSFFIFLKRKFNFFSF